MWIFLFIVVRMSQLCITVCSFLQSERSLPHELSGGGLTQCFFLDFIIKITILALLSHSSQIHQRWSQSADHEREPERPGNVHMHCQNQLGWSQSHCPYYRARFGFIHLLKMSPFNNSFLFLLVYLKKKREISFVNILFLCRRSWCSREIKDNWNQGFKEHCYFMEAWKWSQQLCHRYTSEFDKANVILA